jgi:hypothetical protein
LTATSRRAKAAYIVGRYAMRSARSSSPTKASTKARKVCGPVSGVTKPRVKSADPLRRSA